MNGHIMRSMKPLVAFALILLTIVFAAACGKKKLPVAAAPAPAPPPVSAPAPTTSPTQPVVEALPVPQEPRLSEDQVGGRSLDDLNRDSPFKPVFFGLDSADVDDEGQKVAQANAAIMKKYPTWMVTIEGHCDERGTAEYNLALGERRATSVKTYMVSLGIPADRIRIVSYGKEFPFDPAHTDEAWAKNRRAHFVITSK
jgi:peptidoglycan-associated lipoprotein